MKKLFTPLLLFLTVLLGGISASAEDEVFELTADMFYTWTGYDQNAVKGSQFGDVEYNIGNGKELSGGNVVCGTGGVANNIYADLTGSSKLIFTGTVGLPLRVLMNRQADNSLIEKNPVIEEDGTAELDLTEFAYVHINAIKVGNGPTTGVVNSIKIVKPSDPLAVPKEQLKNQISTAKLYNGIAYTEDSFADLQTAISEGESALAAANATEGSLGTAVTNIANAIMGLTLAEEYSNLTADMFKEYSTYDEPGEGKATYGAYELLKSTNNPYGTGGSDNNRWADLSKYDKLLVVFSGNDKPRVWINRSEFNGQDGSSIEDSKMLDLQQDNGKWSTKKYTTFEQDNNLNIFIVDLNTIKADYNNVARLHGIKYGWGVNGIVTGLYLFKAADPLKMPKEALQTVIDNAKLYDAYAKTTDSFAVLTKAIADAEAALTAENATVDSLADAGKAIADAIEGLELEDGYENLTAGMYKTYQSYEEAVESENQEPGAYELFKSTNNPYGTGGSDNNRWADLSAYDKLIVTFLGNDKPRVWINRSEFNGQDGSSIEDSKMLDLQQDNGKWSTKEYTNFEQDNNLNIFTVDLSKIKKDYDKVARLHGIKYGWGVNGIVTGMYLYTSTDDLELPLEALKNEISKAEQCDKFLKTEESLIALQTAINEGKDILEEAKPTVESVEAATAKITEAIAGLTLKPGYSELTKEMYKKYNSVDNPGEGEPATGDFKLSETTGQPFGVSTVDYDKWAELTDYDQLIVKTDGTGGKPRFLMNRLVDGGQQGPTMDASNMLDITFGADSWSANAYAGCEDDAYSIDLTKMIDDYGFARLNTIKTTDGNVYVTGMYLYKDPANASGFNLTFDIDDPNHVVVEIDGEKITDLNEMAVANRAKLSIAPAAGFKLTSVTAGDDVYVKINDGILKKTIVKNISFEIKTEVEDPLAQPKKDLSAAIEGAKLYDSFAKTEESFTALTDAIAAAETALEADDATETSLTTAGNNISKAIDGLTLAEGYSYLTAELFKKYASAEEPGEGEDTDCAYDLFKTSRMPYGADNEKLKWADLSMYDQLVVTTVGDGDLPRFCFNDEVSTKFEINPYDGTNEATENYQTTEDHRYIIDLKKIVKENAFAHLHSIQVNGWGTGAFVNGLYLYKNPNAKESIKLNFNVDDASHVVIKAGETEIKDFSNDIEVEENTVLTIAANAGCILESVTANGEPVEITDNKYEVTLDEESDRNIKYVITTIDVFEQSKENLSAKIAMAKLHDAYAKTADSFAVLTKAIADAEAALTAENATVDSLADAGKAIADAIEGLELEDGYENLTAGMYKTYQSYEEAVESENQEPGAYELFKSTNNPYGTGGSDNNRWADLSAYDKLIVTFLGNDKPRVWINRSEFNGQDGSSIEDSKMLDLQQDNGKWSTKEYTNFEQDNNLNIFTVDLSKIKKDYDKVARLHGIKYGWGVNGIVTGMYLYTSTDDLELPLEALKNEISKAEQCDKFLKTEESLIALQTAINEGKDILEEAKPTVESVEAATAKITEAIAGLTLKPGYSELTKEMYKKYNSVDNPGEGEPATGDFKLSETTGQPFGVSTVDYDKWAELTDYDQLIVKTDGTGGKPRFLMNRLVDGGQQGPTMDASNMLDITFGADSWSANAYAGCEDDAYSIDLTKMIDDYGFARLNTIKTTDGNVYVTGMYLYKDPANASGFNLTFDIDDPNHVVVEIDGEKITDLNEMAVANRAKLSIAPAAGFKLTSVTAGDDVYVKINDGILKKTIVKNISFEIKTEVEDPLAQPKKDLSAAIEGAKLYDSFAKTEESFTALTDAIAAAETALEADDATETSLTTAGNNISKAIDGLTLAEGYSYLTAELFKKYASAEEPGEGEDTDCAYDLFKTSRMPYGADNEKLKWADLSMYDQLVVTTVGDGDLPRFCFNDEVSTKFEINPYDGTNEATENYQTTEDHRYIIDLKKIVKENAFAHLHSIQVNGWGTGAFVNGLYLYKNPNAKESIKLNFNVDDASHVVIKAGETEIKDFSNDIEVEENTVLTIAPAEGFVLKSITANEKEVALTDGTYTTTVTASVNYVITTEVETPVDPFEVIAAWWHEWDGYGPNASKVEDSTKTFTSNLGVAQTQGSHIIGDPGCSGACYADLSEFGGIEGTGTPGITVRLYINRQSMDSNTGDALDIKVDIKEDGTYKYDFSELPGKPSYVHLNFVKTALGYQGGKWPEGLEKATVETMRVFAKPSEAALAKKNLEKELAKANLYDEYAKTADSFRNLTDAIAEGNAALGNDAATAEEVNKAITAIQNAIAGLELQEGYSDFTADMFKKYDSVEDLGEGNAIQNVNFKLFETTDQPLGGGNISELEWADLTQYDKLVVTVKEGTPRILMNRLAFGAQEYEDGEYTGKFLDMTEGDDHYSTNRYLTVEGNAYTVDLAKMVDDFGFARLNALKFKGFGAKGMVNGLYLYYKDPTVKREYDLTFDIDDASHAVVKVNGETKQVASNGVLKVADRAKLTIAPAADYILTSATANDEAVELKNGMVTKTIVKNISYKITTDLADPFTEQKEALTAIIENAKLYDATAKTEDSFNALTDAIAEAEAELVNEKMSDESLKAAGDAVNEAIKGLELDANYYQLTPDMYKSHESLANPVETAEDPGCANGLMTATEVPYGNKNNDILKWADLSKYSKLIITTDGKYAPRFYFNRLEANGQQAATMEESKMIDINPATEAWSSEYLTVEGNKYTIDLRMLVKDNNRLARLHSIQSNTYEKSILVTGMYLYKEPQVAATEITLDKTEVSKLTYGETVKLTATVDPVDATDPIFWSSSDDEVATVDENGNVTVVGVGNATITASCGDFTADCDFECYPMFGDANWDGTIDVTDAVDIVNYVIEKKDDVPANDVEEWTKFYVAGANVNNDEDGKITFADASAAVKLALDQPVAAPTQNRVAAAFDVESEDALVVGGISAADGWSSVAVTLDNSIEYVALQADIIIPEGMNVEVKEGRRVADSHIMATRKIADNHIRVALYNLGNTAFAENNAPIIEIIADGMIADNKEIAICNIIAADTDANRFVLASKAADTNRVEALGFDSNAPVKVYDLDGRYISDKVDNLEQGIYIFRQGNNAKKVRIR